MSILKNISPLALIKLVIRGLLAFNGVIVLVMALLLVSYSPAYAQEGAEEPAAAEQQQSDNAAIGAALATGLATIGAGFAVGISGSAAIGAITEKPEVLGRTLIFVGLAEGIAIYGLIVSFIILTGGV